MYERRSRLSDWKRDRLIEHFVAGTTGRAAAELVGVHRNTASSFYTRLRKVIAEEMEKASPVAGEIEVDESYFGGARTLTGNKRVTNGRIRKFPVRAHTGRSVQADAHRDDV